MPRLYGERTRNCKVCGEGREPGPADKTDSVRVDGPNGERVQVLFYDDGSMRFRIYDCPMVIEQAFLTGNKQDHAIIKVAPKRA